MSTTQTTNSTTSFMTPFCHIFDPIFSPGALCTTHPRLTICRFRPFEAPRNAKLRNFAMTVGTRDSRKIMGTYNLTGASGPLQRPFFVFSSREGGGFGNTEGGLEPLVGSVVFVLVSFAPFRLLFVSVFCYFFFRVGRGVLKSQKAKKEGPFFSWPCQFPDIPKSWTSRFAKNSDFGQSREGGKPHGDLLWPLLRLQAPWVHLATFGRCRFFGYFARHAKCSRHAAGKAPYRFLVDGDPLKMR